MKKPITILIPTYNRPSALAVLLTSLCAQTYKDFDIIISDQSDMDSENDILMSVVRVLKEHGHTLKILKHLPRRGMAEQRQFLLDQSKTSYSLFLDDDLLLESWVIAILYKVISEQQIGFVGCAPIGLSYKHDIRPEEEYIEFWDEKVLPEKVVSHTKKWKRYTLHNAANMYHAAAKFGINPHQPRLYKVAWIGACVMYNTEKLRDVGGFSFWEKLPAEHVGEDVLAQIRVMEKYGGCGILPSGVYHMELPTTIVNRKVNAPEYVQ